MSPNDSDQLHSEAFMPTPEAVRVAELLGVTAKTDADPVPTIAGLSIPPERVERGVVILPNSVLSVYSVAFAFTCAVMGTIDTGTLTFVFLGSKVPETEAMQKELNSLREYRGTKEGVVLLLHAYFTALGIPHFLIMFTGITSNDADVSVCAGDLTLREYA